MCGQCFSDIKDGHCWLYSNSKSNCEEYPHTKKWCGNGSLSRKSKIEGRIIHKIEKIHANCKGMFGLMVLLRNVASIPTRQCLHSRGKQRTADDGINHTLLDIVTSFLGLRCSCLVLRQYLKCLVLRMSVSTLRDWLRLYRPVSTTLFVRRSIVSPITLTKFNPLSNVQM